MLQMIRTFVDNRIDMLTASERDDRDQCHTTVSKIISFAKEHGSRKLYKQALRTLLPSSPVYDYLEGRIQSSALTYLRLSQLTEAEEKERINKEIGERRTRLGAKLGQVTSEVKCEVFATSELESLYQNIIDWTQDDEVRREYEQKLFERACEHLAVLPLQEKGPKRDQVMKMAGEMVIIKHRLESAWTLHLEWRDVDDLADLDIGVLREFILFFSKSGIAKLLQAHLGETCEPTETKDVDGEAENGVPSDERKAKPITDEERLLLLTEGLDDAKDSAFSHRIASDYYRTIEEYESCMDVSRRGLSLLQQQEAESGLHFQRNKDAINSNLATSLVYHLAPKYHPEAKDIFDEILTRKPTATTALLGLGLILEEREDFEKASNFLDQASLRDPQNLHISTEAAWCRALTGDLEAGLRSLQNSIQALEKSDMRGLRALTLFRVGRCLWNLSPDKASRKDRRGAYSYFIASLKANPNLASAYTSLGLYYSDYSKDRRRAKQCFQKAFELSATEVQAAERLARTFADESDWDVVEVIAQRVINSGVAKPAPGSKKKGVSWPFSALGIVNMTKQDFPKAVISYQAALRIAPKDYYSWVGLGESYHSSGRYIAAQKTLEHAKLVAAYAQQNASGDSWFAEYMLSNVLRELGDFDEAITGYESVLMDRPGEFGLSLALLQTLVERAYHGIEIGFFGLAANSARSALDAAMDLTRVDKQVFNVWKAIADALAVFLSVSGNLDLLPLDTVREILLSSNAFDDSGKSGDDHDPVNQDMLRSILADCSNTTEDLLQIALVAALLAYKNAIAASSDQVHAQAVGWYNLGYMELKASSLISAIRQPKLSKKRLTQAPVRCFKRAIELEAGNAEFWNALGVSTTTLNPSVAQHSFVRSLHLNERSARTWTNLGTLYLIQGDHELAHGAFARAQSTDPEYALAWVGEGLIAAQLGDPTEALSHFLHAAEIADDAASLVKSRYSVSTFDNLSHKTSSNAALLAQPIFVLQQLEVQAALVDAYKHLLALLQERVGQFQAAIDGLTEVASHAEALFDETEDPEYLAQFAQAKADLARICLQNGDYTEAIEHAGIALDLTSEADSGSLTRLQRHKLRLSAYVSGGLSHYRLSALAESESTLREALQETGNAPDVICFLAQVLWATGEEGQRNLARDLLFACVETQSNHPQATSLIGAMSAIDEDEATLGAVTEDLQTLRTSGKLSTGQRRQLETLVDAIAVLVSSNSSGTNEAMVSVMLAPEQTTGWSSLASASAGDEDAEAYTNEMAAITALHAASAEGTIDASDLSHALASTGTVGDSQRAIALAPWLQEGWNSLLPS